jgi:uncharacterized protein YndB with AHSA1/START domain
MDKAKFQKITVTAIINEPMGKVWDTWTRPEHIKHWCYASDDWHAPYAENDIRTGGKFLTRMEAKDGSFGFDFEGIYENVEPFKAISYVLADERRIDIAFIDHIDTVEISETFDAETENTIEQQRFGWQAILDNFKKYAEESIH